MIQAVAVDSRTKSSSRNFVAINYIRCKQEYRARFEELFGTRAHAIDRMAGFIDMHVLRPQTDDGEYLIVSFWETEETFKAWTQSPEFLEGHKRGFEDIRTAKERGEDPPMKSDFKTYEVIAR
jgi:heme-degrading monooxygenase HmoA